MRANIYALKKFLEDYVKALVNNIESVSPIILLHALATKNI